MSSLSLVMFSLGPSVQSHTGQLTWKVETPNSPQGVQNECKCTSRVCPEPRPVNTWRSTSTLWPWTGINGCRRWMDVFDAVSGRGLSSQMSHLSAGQLWLWPFVVSTILFLFFCRLFLSRWVHCHIKCGLWDMSRLIQWNTCKCRCQDDNHKGKAAHCSLTFNWHSLKGSD